MYLDNTEQFIINSYIDMGYKLSSGATASHPMLTKQEDSVEHLLLKGYNGKWVEGEVDKTSNLKLPIPKNEYSTMELFRKLQIDKLI